MINNGIKQHKKLLLVKKFTGNVYSWELEHMCMLTMSRKNGEGFGELIFICQTAPAAILNNLMKYLSHTKRSEI